jgi:hypothetical protein
VDKNGNFFKKVTIIRLWKRSFDFLLFVWEKVPRRFYFRRGFLKRNILFIVTGKAPFYFRRREFYFKDFWGLRFSFYNILVIRFPRVFIVREVNLIDVVFKYNIPLNMVSEILCFL